MTKTFNAAVNSQNVVNVAAHGAIGDGSHDDTAAIQAAINTLHSSGGTVFFPSGKYKISAPLLVGNGTNAAGLGGWSTYAGVTLQGPSYPSGIGNYNPLGQAALITTGNMSAISIKGPITGGWSVKDLFIDNSTSTAGASINIVEGQFGNIENVQIIAGAYGIVVATYGNNLAYHMDMKNVGIFMPSGLASAVGIILSGTSTMGSGLVTVEGLTIIPTNSGHTGVILQATDSNVFIRYNYMDAAHSSTALLFDYTLAPGYPTANFFYQMDPYSASIAINGSPIESGLMEPNRILLSQTNGARIPSLAGVVIERHILGADKSFYVSTTGSDTTGSGYSGNPWATVQHAYDQIITHYDLAGYTATIVLGAGTYTSGITSAGKITGLGNIIIDGGSVATIHTTSAHCITATNNTVISVKNIKLLTTSAGFGLLSTNGGIINFTGVEFGACASGHMLANYNGEINATGNYTITGAAPVHLEATATGKILTDTITVTISGTPAFSSMFALATTLGYIEASGVTYSGSASGVRYSTTNNAIINTNGGGASYLPGSSSGSTGTGGLYL